MAQWLQVGKHFVNLDAVTWIEPGDKHYSMGAEPVRMITIHFGSSHRLDVPIGETTDLLRAIGAAPDQYDLG